jgi:hypothetical protein
MTGTVPHAGRTGLMDDTTFVGLDVHKATVCVAVAESGRGRTGVGRPSGRYEVRADPMSSSLALTDGKP